MFDLNLYNITLKESFLAFILVLSLVFLSILFVSLLKNRNRILFYSLVIKDDGQVSKIGIAFIFLLILLVYQVITETEVSSYLVELLGIIFAAEIGTKYVDNKTITNKDMTQITKQLKSIDKNKMTAPAKNIDDIDFNSL